jgi:hypothetical protein
MKFPCRAFRSETCIVHQFIVDSQQFLERVVVDHHSRAVYVTFSGRGQAGFDNARTSL